MKERKTIYIDDATGKQIASAEDARTGGARILRGQEADAWLSDNADKALPKKAEEKAETQPAETKEQPKAQNKGAKADS